MTCRDGYSQIFYDENTEMFVEKFEGEDADETFNLNSDQKQLILASLIGSQSGEITPTDPGLPLFGRQRKVTQDSISDISTPNVARKNTHTQVKSEFTEKLIQTPGVPSFQQVNEQEFKNEHVNSGMTRSENIESSTFEQRQI